MPGLTIGEVAKTLGIGVETIRFYERQGLIIQPQKPLAGFRKYSDTTLRRLRFIVRAKQIGFSLREIRELLAFYFDGQANCADVRQHARQKIDDIYGRIDVLQKMASSLEQLVSECEDGAERCPLLEKLAEDI